MLTLAECHAENPYRDLLADLRPLTVRGDANLARAVWAWTHAREDLEIAVAASADVQPAFERERAGHHEEIDALHRRWLTSSLSEKVLMSKRIDEHTRALARMNLMARMDAARRRLKDAELRLKACGWAVEGMTARVAETLEPVF